MSKITRITLIISPDKTMAIKPDDFHFPNAINWMWTYCIPLGKYIDQNNRKYDLGVYVRPDTKEVSHAIVYGNEPGDYLSGWITAFKNSEVRKENIMRYERLVKWKT